VRNAVFLIFACSAAAFAERSHAFRIKYVSGLNNPVEVQARFLLFLCYLQERRWIMSMILSENRFPLFGIML